MIFRIDSHCPETGLSGNRVDGQGRAVGGNDSKNYLLSQRNHRFTPCHSQTSLVPAVLSVTVVSTPLQVFRPFAQLFSQMGYLVCCPFHLFQYGGADG